MKRIIFCLFLACTTLCYAESNYPTIFSDYDQKGPYVGMDVFSQDETLSLIRGLLKHWTLCYHTKDGGYTVREFCVDPRDSIVNDRSYARVTLEKLGTFYGSSDTPVDTLLYRQEGDKVYLLSPTEGKDVLLLDYGLSLGDHFVSPQGKTFVVTAVGHAEDLAKMGSTYWNDGCKIRFDETSGPKVLCLKSEDGQEEDLWIEGAGSACWGIVPTEIVEGLRDASSQIVKSNLLHTPGIDMDVVFSLDEEDCKLVYFEPEDIDYSQVDPNDYERYVAEHPLEYTFEGDTLCISGLADLNCVTAYAMCDIKDGDISIKMDHFYPLGVMLPCKSYRFANVRIPGFKAGEYTIGGVTLVCEGSSKEENYVPIIQQNKLWKVGRYVLNTDPAENLSYYYFDGDTVSVGLLYSKMMRATLTKEDAKMTYMGGVRENGKRVYICPFGMEKEYLMYDFGANVGDTLEVYCPESTRDTWRFLVVGKNSIESEAGKLCRLSLAPWQSASGNFGSPSCVWIEGVGSDGGPCAGAYDETPYGMYRDILMSCVIGETTTLYANEILAEDISPNWEWLWKEGEDVDGPHNVKKQKLDFTHVVKTKPIRNNAPDATSLEGEYDNVVMGLGFFGLDGTYVLTITDEGGAALFSQSLSTEALLSMDILLNSYADGEYTITVENDAEAYVGHFSLPVLGEGIQSLRTSSAASGVYDLSGRRVDAKAYENGKLKKGIYIKDGWKMVIK